MSKTFYSRESFADAVTAAFRREVGKYGKVDRWMHKALDKYPVRELDVLNIGSADQGFGPWYEAMLFARGARVTTTDYNEVEFEDAPSEVRFLDPSHVHRWSFDVITAISSIEHSGLGRYGEPLDEDGDLHTMRWLSGSLKSSGFMLLAVPLGLDETCGIWHRVYGRSRLPRLLAGWTLVDSFGYDVKHLDLRGGWDEGLHPECPEYSPILVLRKDR